MNDTKTKQPSSGSWLKNTLTRVASAAVLVPLVFWLLFSGPSWAFTSFALLVVVIAARELFLMVLPDNRILGALGTVMTLGMAASIALEPHPQATLMALVATGIIGLVGGLASPEPIESAATRLGWLIGGPAYLGSCFGVLILLSQQPDGGSWVILAMFFAFGSDTGGYFAGKFFGKRKLYPKVSPKKTVAGSIGGLVVAAGGAVVAHFWLLPTLPLVDGIILAIVAGGVGQLGDLCVSLIKRSCGVKDSGALIPGHGGALDRIDALAFTGALTWLYYAIRLSS